MARLGRWEPPLRDDAVGATRAPASSGMARPAWPAHHGSKDADGITCEVAHPPARAPRVMEHSAARSWRQLAERWCAVFCFASSCTMAMMHCEQVHECAPAGPAFALVCGVTVSAAAADPSRDADRAHPARARIAARKPAHQAGAICHVLPAGALWALTEDSRSTAAPTRVEDRWGGAYRGAQGGLVLGFPDDSPLRCHDEAPFRHHPYAQPRRGASAPSSHAACRSRARGMLRSPSASLSAQASQAGRERGPRRSP